MDGRHDEIRRVDRSLCVAAETTAGRAESGIRYGVVIGVGIIVLVGALVSLLTRLGVDHSRALTLGVGCADVLIVIVLRGEGYFSKAALPLAAAGAAVGFLYFAVSFGTQRVTLVAADSSDYLFYLVYGAVLAPLFEEATLRGMIFPVLCGRTGCAAGSAIVSAAFALAHPNMMGYAFALSLCLCILTRLGVRTADRAAMHGAHNLVLQILFAIGGLASVRP